MGLFFLSAGSALAQSTTNTKPTKAEIVACMKQATEKKNMAIKDADNAWKMAKDTFKTSKDKKIYTAARMQHTKALRMAKNNFNKDNRMCKKTKVMAKKPILTIPLIAQNNSGESGTALLKEKDGKVTVSLALSGAPNVIQPAHIHMGGCANLNGIKYPLSFPVNGVSETLLDVTLAQLKSEFPLAINVHASTADASTYVACGDLTW